VQPTLREEVEPPAPHAELESLIARFDRELEATGYYFPPERTEATRTTMRTILTKPQWSSREIKAMHGMLRQMTERRRD
jgi:tRNA/rRNA methyltransferase